MENVDVRASLPEASGASGEGSDTSRWRVVPARHVALVGLVLVASACDRTDSAVYARPVAVLAAGEGDRRDPLRMQPPRLWARPSLTGAWCQLPIGTPVAVADASSTPPRAVVWVSDTAGRCQGWIASSALAPLEDADSSAPAPLPTTATADVAVVRGDATGETDASCRIHLRVTVPEAVAREFDHSTPAPPPLVAPLWTVGSDTPRVRTYVRAGTVLEVLTVQANGYVIVGPGGAPLGRLANANASGLFLQDVHTGRPCAVR